MSLDSISGKKYGLIIPNKKSNKEPIRISSTEKAFGEESGDEDEANFKQPTFDVKMETIKASLRKTTKINLEKALEEDASVFQYDEIYDEITREKDQKLLEKNTSARKPKYVDKLLQASAVRRLEKELLTERKAQRELEAEQEKYGDKESFVTGAYKKKMAELRELVERRREEEAREEVMDVTKQDGLGGFYRYMFQQKTASSAPTSLGASEPKTGSSGKDVNAERSPSRTQSPPPRHRHKDEAEISPASPAQSPLPRRENDYRPRGKGHGRRPDEAPSSSPRHPRRYRRSESREYRSHRDRRRRSSSRPRHARYHDDRKRREHGGREDEGKGKQAKGSSEVPSSNTGGAISKTAALPLIPKPSPPPPGFIRAKPRKTTEEEVEAARQRFLARKAAGLTRPTVVVSDDEA